MCRSTGMYPYFNSRPREEASLRHAECLAENLISILAPVRRRPREGRRVGAEEAISILAPVRRRQQKRTIISRDRIHFICIVSHQASTAHNIYTS